jgi:hypothetical protein
MADYNWYLSEAEKNYAPTRESIQNQINAIPTQQQAAVADVNKQYQTQQTNLNNQLTGAKNSASMGSAMRGGAFGGQANIQNEKYYNNTFVPAQTNLQDTLNSNLRTTNETYQNRKFDLENYLNSLIDEQRKYGQSQWQAAEDREAAAREAEASRRAAAAAQQSSLAAYLGGSGGQASQPAIYDDYNGRLTADPNGRWDEGSQTWRTANGAWKWNQMQNKWQLVSGAPANDYDWKIFTPQSQQGVIPGAPNTGARR